MHRSIIKGDPPVTTKAQILTQKWYKPIINTYDVVCIWFYAEWCQGTKHEPYGKEYDKAANVIAKLYPRERHQRGKAIMVKVNCNDEKVLSNMFNVWCYPTYRIIKNGEVQETHFENPRLAECFLQFIEEFIEEKEERKAEFDRIPIRFAHYTHKLRMNTYSKFVREHDFVFVFFYAGWYKTCREAVNVYEQAYREMSKLFLTGYEVSVYWYKKFQNKPKVMFARMEAGYNADVIKKFNIRKYPTFILIRNGSVKAEYNGECTVEGFTNFIKLHRLKHDKELSKKTKPVDDDID